AFRVFRGQTSSFVSFCKKVAVSLSNAQSLNSTFQYARSTKCFQRSCCGVEKVIWTNGRHFGRLGLRIKLMCASRGSRLPLRVLHPMHEQTTFSHVVVPPRSRGTT